MSQNSQHKRDRKLLEDSGIVIESVTRIRFVGGIGMTLATNVDERTAITTAARKLRNLFTDFDVHTQESSDE